MLYSFSRRTVLSVAAVILVLVALIGHGDIVSSQETSLVLPVTESQGEPSIKIDPENDGGTWLKLHSGRNLKQRYPSELAGQSPAAKRTRPLTMTSGDLNLDGFPDLLVAYGTDRGGFLAVHRGNPGSFAPTDPQTIDGIKNGNFPDPFLPDALFLPLDEAPDFVAIGDFDRDTRQDIVAAARGGSRILFIAGDGQGNFDAPTTIWVPGIITALAAGQKNVLDSYEDLIVGTSDGVLHIFDSAESIAKGEPEKLQLPAAASDLILGNLDGDGATDLAIAAGGRFLILHGSEHFESDGIYRDGRAGELETVDLAFPIKSFVLGEFIFDRESRTEIAALGEDGKLRVLTQGEIDTRPFSESEILARRRLMNEVRQGTRPARDLQPRNVNRSRDWIVAEEIDAGDSPILTNARISAQPADDLIVSDAANKKIQILNRPQTADRNVAELRTTGELIALLPMRLNVMAQPSLVVLQKGQIEPTLVMVAPEATFDVDRNDDNAGATTCDAGANNCSLRGAVIASNANGTGADLITFSANLPILTITGTDNAAALGDLDINGNLTVMGNGSGTTIIDTTYITGCGDCKVFGVNQSGAFSGIAVSFTGVTIQDGFNTRVAVGDFQETGGGIDFFLTGTGNAYSITNSIVTSNEARTQVQSYGGGINIDSASGGVNAGTVTCTGSTVSNNFSDSTGGGLNLFSDVHNVTFNNCVVSGNQATSNGAGLGANGGGMFVRHTNGGAVAIHDTDITSNSGKGFGGGLSVTLNQTLTIDNGSTITNNTVSNATGIDVAVGGGIQTGGTTTTLSAVTITGNQATGASNPQGGGVYMDGGTISITGGSISTNTASGATAKGGGISQTGGIATLTTVTVSGNTAGGDGGGVFLNGTGAAPANAQLTMTNGSITTNSANRGGGFATDSISTGAATLNTVTFTNNTAATDTGGIFQMGSATGSIAINGIAFTGNTSPTLKTSGGTMSTLNTVSVDNAVTVAGGTLTLGTSTFTVSGAFTESSGTVNGNTSTFNAVAGSTLSGGTFNAGGTFNVTGTHTQSGGTFNGGGVVTLTGTGNFSKSSGTFTGNSITVNLVGSFSHTGGTFTAGSSTFNFNGSGAQSISNSALITFNHISDVNATQPLTFNNSVNVNGTVTANGANTILNPVAAAVIGGTGTLTGTGTARVTRATGTNDFLTQYTITNKTLTNLLIDYVGPGAQGISGITYTNIRLNNASGGTLSAPAIVNGTLTLALGAFNVGTSTLTLNNVITITGGSLTSSPTGTVIYNQGSNGQQVVVGNYGNLTFSNFDKILPAAGTVGISGTFTPGTAVGHTITGSTIDFNGTGAQTIPAFNYNNLTISGAHGANNVTLVNGGTIGIAGTFSPTATFAGGNYVVTNNTINFNGSGGQTIPAFNYNNLTSSSTGARILANSGTIRIAGIFTPGTNVYTITGSTMEYNGAAAQTLPPTFTTYNNLTLNNITTVLGFPGLTVQGLLRVQAGTFTSSSTYNNVQIDAGATLAGTAATTINVSGNWTNNGTFTANSNTVIFNGGSAQAVGGSTATTFNNLWINNSSGGVTFNTSATVNGVLTLQFGDITTGANTLTIDTTGTVNRTSGHVIGNLRKNFGGPGPAFEIPVGTPGAYTPLNVTVTNGSGQLTTRATATFQPVLAPISDRVLQRYWTLSGSGIRSNITFNYLDGDVPGPPNDENIWAIIRVTGSVAVRYQPTLPYVIMNPAGNQFTINDLESYSDWTAGEPLAPTAGNASVSGRVVDADGRAVSGAQVAMQNQQGNVIRALTNPFGYYRFESVPVGQTYLVTVQHKRFEFQPRTINLNDDLADLDFTAEP
jgi:hypothetical protein